METIDHIFRDCPISVEAWSVLNFTHILNKTDMDGLLGPLKFVPHNKDGYYVYLSGQSGFTETPVCMKRGLVLDQD